MLLTLTITFTVTGIISWWLTTARGHWLALDIPNERSLHSRPTPRTGGIAILLGTGTGLLAAWLWNGYTVLNLPLTAAVLVLALVALLDDRHTLGAGPRLLTQIGVVSLLLFTQQIPISGSLALIAALLFLVWMINLYNFMDGMDGFAAGMAVFGFGTFALLAWQTGHLEFALGCAVIVAAAAGFLLLNFPPARLFMGDTGSTVLGLLAGVVILHAHSEAILPVWLGLLVFSPFIVDASITLSTRILGGKKFWQAHKTHYYQRVVQIGWGHKRTVLAEYALMMACSATALAVARQPFVLQTTIIAAWAVIYVILIYWIHRAERRREQQT
jgi:UDP-N-acetylmuramyl pentapeptide phosphotransferase/UDP-N-acetylglucosamine-1-phosphate transferase